MIGVQLLAFDGHCAAQAWQTVHPPARGTLISKPRVHIGFWRSWTANDLAKRVKQRVVEILKSGGVDKKDVKLYITGAWICCCLHCCKILRVILQQLSLPALDELR